MQGRGRRNATGSRGSPFHFANTNPAGASRTIVFDDARRDIQRR